MQLCINCYLSGMPHSMHCHIYCTSAWLATFQRHSTYYTILFATYNPFRIITTCVVTNVTALCLQWNGAFHIKICEMNTYRLSDQQFTYIFWNALPPFMCVYSYLLSSLYILNSNKMSFQTFVYIIIKWILKINFNNASALTTANLLIYLYWSIGSLYMYRLYDYIYSTVLQKSSQYSR